MQAKLQLLLARTSLAFASSTRSRGRFVAVKSFGLFSVMLVLGLLMSFQGMATSIDMTTTIISTPATGGTAVGYSTVSFSAITTNPSNSQTFNGVQQQIAISGVSTALYTALTFSGTGTVSYSSATSTVTIVFPTADLAKNTSRTESENLVVPGNVTPASITAAVSYNNISGADTDPTLGNNNGSAANARSTVNLTPAPAPTITSFTPTSGTAAGGTTITVNGTNFGNTAPTATVAGVAATSVTYISATQITLVTPAKVAGTAGVVTITTVVGTATSGQSYTYVTPPTITSFTPNSGLVLSQRS